MPNIALLDQNTIDKIAAGEVIERPSSVVKELVENAIDAKATAITVEIKEGGTSFIRITDNGCGISKEDASIAFLRHSTSKIRNVDDLLSISSLGFRGEALSSIAAVANVELITKTKSSLMGIRYVIEGSVEKEFEEIGAPDGTTFLVRKLFFNTPARRKFLKTPQTEAGYINDLLEKMALSHPDVSFKFINNNQTKLHTSGNGNLKDVIYHIYGREIASNLVEINREAEGVKVYGFIGKPIISRGNRNYENYYVNGRYVKSGIVAKAIEEAYKTFMMQHKYPFTALHFEIDGNMLDVNVHPTKMELRFSENEQMYRFIYEAVKEGLNKREFIPEVTVGENKSEEKRVIEKAPEPFEKKRLELNGIKNISNISTSNDILEKANNVFAKRNEDKKTDEVKQENNSKVAMMFREAEKEYVAKTSVAVPKEKMLGTTKHIDFTAESKAIDEKQSKDNILSEEKIKEVSNEIDNKIDNKIQNQETSILEKPVENVQQIDMFEQNLLDKESRDKHKIIGQVFGTYWIVQFQEKMYIIDQHAAHEKVLYERTMKGLKEHEFTSQLLSPPIILTLSMQEKELLDKYMDNFVQLGYEIEPFGGKEYSVRAVPANLFGLASKDVLIEILDGLAENMGSATTEMITDKIASMSCKAAVKGNTNLSVMEAQELIDELMTLDNPYNCPHGRPTIISMTKYELEKKFKRIV